MLRVLGLLPAAWRGSFATIHEDGLSQESRMTLSASAVQQLWRDCRAEPTVELRNQLVEIYLHLVKSLRFPLTGDRRPVFPTMHNALAFAGLYSPRSEPW